MSSKPRQPSPRPTSKIALGVARCVGLGSASVCGLAFFLGTLPDSGNPLDYLLPVASAAALAVGLASAWHYVLGIAAYSEGELHRQAVAVGFGVALFLFGCASSAWFLASKIGGESALASYRLGYLARLDAAADTVAANAAAEAEIIAAIQAGANDLDALADAEGSTGVKSGRVGHGVVWATLKNAATSLSASASALERKAADRRDELSRATDALDDARKAVAAHDAAQFQESASRAADRIKAASKLNLAASVAALGVGLSRDYAGAAINEALADVANAARRVAENRRAVTVPDFQPVDTREAVRLNPPALAWLAAVAVEALPLAMLGILLTLWRRERDDDEQAEVVAQPVPLRPRPTLTAAE